MQVPQDKDKPEQLPLTTGPIEAVHDLPKTVNRKLKGHEIFQRALDLGLTQVRCSFGDAAKGQACAIGAINYVLSDGQRVLPNKGRAFLAFFSGLVHSSTAVNSQADEIISAIERASNHSVDSLNDDRRWSFEDFRDYCKRHNI